MLTQLRDILPLVQRHPRVKVLRDILRDATPSVVCCEGLMASSAPVVLSAAVQSLKASDAHRPLLVVISDEEQAGYFYHDLTQMLGDEDVMFLPSSYRRAVKYGQRDGSCEILRNDVLSHLSTSVQHTDSVPQSSLIVVTFPQALAERVASPSAIDEHTLYIEEGKEYDLPQLEHRLLDLGFHRRDYVYEPGEFAVRGSILDVYSYSSEYPFRIDFFGDEVDSIRTFEVQSQLSKEQKHDVSIVPNVSDATLQGLVPITDLLPADTCLVVDDLVLAIDLVEKTFNEGFVRQAVASADIASDLKRDMLLVRGGELLRGLQSLQRILLKPTPNKEKMRRLTFDTAPQPLFHKNFDLLKQTFAEMQRSGTQIYVCADSTKQLERLENILQQDTAGVGAITLDGQMEGVLHAGYVDATLGIAVFTDHEIFDRYHKYNLKSEHVRNAKMSLTLKELLQFAPGDYVVHIDHGIGRFAGLVRQRTATGEMQEMIKLTYKNDDIVLVSIHSLHKVSKYKGKDGQPPALSHLGTGAWDRMKERTKKKLKDIARDLILLYSKRREEKGFSFAADTFMQHELEASFTYEDTPDQLTVTQQVKQDMESARPMDRLVCGDVGFGKTEIAVRAAFKAACDNKQVAVLVPTTVLALQHYHTFVKRLKDFPVRVDYLSRARTAKQTTEVLRDLADGTINIIIGTHKLISKSVKFKDLGLLIIDEEQKFGVSVKEKLRQMRTNVDTLTLTATPIPRTLQFSLMGARDLSIISTPPPNRYPIQTEVHQFSGDIVSDAINFEMSRNGQVYFVTDKISGISSLAEVIRKRVPDARVAIGHGQMPPAELEQIIIDFINHEYDVLLSTTIVENGIDIPNANTIIVDHAHHFGLSDLHQMRGRVGRSNRKAFCYLLAPPLSALPDDSRRRLQAIEQFSDLGSGIHIAMQDLDIRGAGNLLGAEQSGFIADLGYETYQKILSQAVAELRLELLDEEGTDVMDTNDETSAKGATAYVDECALECDLHAYFPETYVPGASERMLLYRELDGMETDQQVSAFRKRLEDRFGELPQEGEELLRVIPLRRMARCCGVERLVLKQQRMMLQFVGKSDSPFYQSEAFGRVINFAMLHVRQCKLDEQKGKRRMIVTGVNSIQHALAVLSQLTGE